MEKRKETVFISFASQKGGVGKSTFTIYAASWLYYVKGLNVAVVDCDYPQYSIMKQKKRDMEVVKTTPVYLNLLVEQAGRLKKKAYPVMGSTPADCMTDWRTFEGKSDTHYDIVLFDLPGTMGSDGVIAAISALNYLFVPIKADRLVLESTLNFATTINDRLVKTGVSTLKSLHLFWNMVDRRERTTLYDVYQQGFSLLGLDCLKTRIPVRSNFTKDLSVTGGPVYRSTLFAPDAAFTKECGFNAFMDEIISILKTE